MCQVCKGGIETILHVIRDCPVMRRIWDRFVPAVKRHAFFSMHLLEWLYKNLSDNGTWSEIPWATKRCGGDGSGDVKMSLVRIDFGEIE